MKTFEIKYNDGVVAETITFNETHTNEFIENFLSQEIKEYNTNCNKLYHITRENIIEIRE